MLNWINGLTLVQVLVEESNFELTAVLIIAVIKSLVQSFHSLLHLTNIYPSPSTYQALPWVLELQNDCLFKVHGLDRKTDSSHKIILQCEKCRVMVELWTENHGNSKEAPKRLSGDRKRRLPRDGEAQPRSRLVSVLKHALPLSLQGPCSGHFPASEALPFHSSTSASPHLKHLFTREGLLDLQD